MTTMTPEPPGPGERGGLDPASGGSEPVTQPRGGRHAAVTDDPPVVIVNGSRLETGPIPVLRQGGEDGVTPPDPPQAEGDAAPDDAAPDDAAPDDDAGSRRTEAEILAEHLAPSRPDPGPGRYLRKVAGMDEEVLDWVPEERARYTRLGAIILNTGLLAGLSLLAALGHVIDAPVPVLLAVAAFWAFLVVSLDSWLIASTHGSTGAFRIVKFVPRLIVSVLLGVVIAEPLVLWAFSPAVHREVQAMRTEELDLAVTRWTQCNPATGLLRKDAACDGWVLDIPGADSPLDQQEALTELERQREALRGRIAAVNAELDRRNDIARRECNGTSGAGLTGERGEGPNCKRNRTEADRFREDSRLPQFQEDLEQLDAQILTATEKVRVASDTYGRQVAAAVTAARKEKERKDAANEVGLLEQSAALGQLSESSHFVFFAHWMLRLLLVALDCLPVFAKLIGGVTSYDRLVSARLSMRRRMHEREVTSVENRYEHQKRIYDDIIGSEVRAGKARRRAEQRADIEDLIAQFRARRRLNGGSG